MRNTAAADMQLTCYITHRDGLLIMPGTKLQNLQNSVPRQEAFLNVIKLQKLTENSG